jgi:hypothetical protein
MLFEHGSTVTMLREVKWNCMSGPFTGKRWCGAYFIEVGIAQ